MAPASSARFASISKSPFNLLGPFYALRGVRCGWAWPAWQAPLGSAASFVYRAHVSLLQQQTISSYVTLSRIWHSLIFNIVGIALPFILHTNLLSMFLRS